MKEDLDGQKYLGERWEAFVRDILCKAPAHEWADHIIAVCDTAEMCQRWLNSHGVPYLAADLIAMTKLILDRQARQEDRHAQL